MVPAPHRSVTPAPSRASAIGNWRDSVIALYQPQGLLTPTDQRVLRALADVASQRTRHDGTITHRIAPCGDCLAQTLSLHPNDVGNSIDNLVSLGLFEFVDLGGHDTIIAAFPVLGPEHLS